MLISFLTQINHKNIDIDDRMILTFLIKKRARPTLPLGDMKFTVLYRMRTVSNLQALPNGLIIRAQLGFNGVEIVEEDILYFPAPYQKYETDDRLRTLLSYLSTIPRFQKPSSYPFCYKNGTYTIKIDIIYSLEIAILLLWMDISPRALAFKQPQIDDLGKLLRNSRNRRDTRWIRSSFLEKLRFDYPHEGWNKIPVVNANSFVLSTLF